MIEETKKNMDEDWTKKSKDGLGTRHPDVQACYDMSPETPAEKLVSYE